MLNRHGWRRSKNNSMSGAVRCGSAPTDSLAYALMFIQAPLEISMYIGLGTLLIIALIVYFVRRA